MLMYNNLLFIIVIFIFSLIYIIKFKKEGFQSTCEFSKGFIGGVNSKMIKPMYRSNAACRRECLNDNSCKSYSWNQSQLQCSHLPKSVEYVRKREGWTKSNSWMSYNKTCESERETIQIPVQPTFCKFNPPSEGMIDINSASKKFNNKTDSECRTLCLEDAVCSSYSYHINDKNCNMYPFSLSYSNKMDKWRNMKGSLWRSYDKICPKTPIITTDIPETILDKGNDIYFYEISESLVDNNDKLMKSYNFKDKSKIIIKLNNTEIDQNIFVSFFVKFSEKSSQLEREIICKQISGDNKTYWSMFRFNGNLYYSINKEYYKFLTPIKIDEYYKIVVSQKGSELTFRINNEPKYSNIDKQISRKSLLVFGGSKDNLLVTPSNFNGSISEIKYGYKEPSMETSEMDQCKFYPKGDGEEDCKTKCKKSNVLTCKEDICGEICKSCRDKISCPWNFEVEDKPNPIPNAPDPIRTTAGNKRVIIEWKKPFEGTTGEIVSYIITVKESYPSNKTNNDEMIYNFEANNCENCQYEIKDLKNTIYYDISVKSQNRVIDKDSVKNYISSTCSNIETIAPIGPINVKDYHPSLIESDEEIKLIYNNTSDRSITCDKKRYKNKNSAIDTLDMNKYSEQGILSELTGGTYNTNKLEYNKNNFNYDNNKIQDDIKQYLGDI